MQSSATTPHVLIVEDDFLTSEMLRGLVEDLGLSVIGNATTGTEAVRLAKFLKPQLILMDIDIPETDGIRATELIEKESPTPIVIVTSDGSIEWVQKAEAAGAGAYVVKPPCISDLEKAIMIAFARFKDQQENQRLKKLLAKAAAHLVKSGTPRRMAPCAPGLCAPPCLRRCKRRSA
jgi:AmiR/NasT family two-component response regulator